ncbi:hypothetical protein [Fredinandcohnia sp. 179-A 10B2 NHS]
MDISDKLTQQKLQDLLMHIYEIGNAAEELDTVDLIEEIRKEFLLIMHSD